MLNELKHKKDGLTKIYCDNKSVIALTKNPIFHGRSKHIDVKHRYIHDLVKDKESVVKYCTSEDQIVDIFTKPLKAYIFIKLKKC